MTTTPDFRALLADDAYAASFQSLGQYRTALLKALATPPPEPVAYIHRQGNHWEVSEHVLLDDEKKRGWTEEPLYASTPPPEAPTDEELDELSWNWYSKTGSTWWQIDSYRAFARAVLERWGRSPAIEPVPVSERCPGTKDWDAEGRCWMFDPCDKGWWSYRSALPSDGDLAPFTHWLSHWALPLPQQAGEVQP
jgi:hypothetical protein